MMVSLGFKKIEDKKFITSPRASRELIRCNVYQYLATGILGQ